MKYTIGQYKKELRRHKRRYDSWLRVLAKEPETYASGIYAYFLDKRTVITDELKRITR